MNVAVLGDVGGHAEQVDRALHELGVRAGRWPHGLHVIQVGDLIGGVDDVAVVDLVEPHLHAGRWTQLLGNWDSRRIGGHNFGAPGRQPPAPAAEARITSWHAAGLTRYAATVTTAAGRTALVTHAGITHDWWIDTLAGESDAQRAAAGINAARLEDLHRPGDMLRIDSGDAGPPGPVWASVAELWTSWLDRPAPWPQIHGHTNAWDYRRRTWSAWTPQACIAYATMNVTQRRSNYRTGRGDGPAIIGIDNSVHAAKQLLVRPLIIAAATAR